MSIVSFYCPNCSCPECLAPEPMDGTINVVESNQIYFNEIEQKAECTDQLIELIENEIALLEGPIVKWKSRAESIERLKKMYEITSKGY